jgi:hypothetical protein
MTTKEVTAPESSERSIEELTRDFYRAVLSAAEKTALDIAEEMDGLDRECAAIRVKVQRILKRRTNRKDLERDDINIRLFIRATNALDRLLSTRYRISKKSQRDLAESITAVLNSARAELGIGEPDGA